MKKHRFFAFLLIILQLLAPTLSANAAVECSARGAVVMEATSGVTLYEKNGDLPLPEASTTKIMTALLVLERADLSATVTVSERAASVRSFLRDSDSIGWICLCWAAVW